jgi:hypothetical protein
MKRWIKILLFALFLVLFALAELYGPHSAAS